MSPLARRSFLAGIGCWFSNIGLQGGVARALAFAQSPASVPAPKPQAAPSAAAPGPTHWFTDIASRSSITYKTNNDFTGRKYFPQPMCGGIAVLDYNRDGWMDLFFTNGAKLPELQKTRPDYYNCLLRNNGDGTFTDVTEKAGLTGKDLGFCFGVAAGDYNNDGYPDLFICNAGANTLYRNNGDGTFTDVTKGSGLDRKPADVLSVGAAWFDFDNDGLLDLIVTNYTTWTPQTDKRCFADAQRDEYCSPTVYKSVESRLYRNLGQGRFEDVTEQSGIGRALGKGMGISIADFNGDGRMDIFVANDTEPNFLFINQGNGQFAERGLDLGVAYNAQGATVSGMGCDAKDLDNDGWVDVLYNDLSGQVFGLLKNESGKAFTDITWSSQLGPLSRRLSGWSIGFIDYNNDGWKDIYSANGDVDDLSATARQSDTMFENHGGTLSDVSGRMGSDFLVPGFQRGSVFVDLNNDGFMDLVVTSLGEKPRILMNNALVKNHWIMFDLRGRASNHDAIGASIKVTTQSGRALYNHLTTSVGFMSSSDPRVHFGLGSESKIREVEIRWPSGIVQRLDSPAVDQIMRIEEPSRPSSSPKHAI